MSATSQPDSPTQIAAGARVLLPDFGTSRIFTYGRVLEVVGPNVKVQLERPSYTEREPFWTSVARCVLARQQGDHSS